MKHVELVNCEHFTKCGNHRVSVSNNIKHLYYYSTEIVTVDTSKKEYSVIPYKISTSTSCAIARYRNYLTMRGYKEVTSIS